MNNIEVEKDKEYLVEGIKSHNMRVYRQIYIIDIDNTDVTYKVLDINFKATLTEHLTDFYNGWNIVEEIK